MEKFHYSHLWHNSRTGTTRAPPGFRKSHPQKPQEGGEIWDEKEQIPMVKMSTVSEELNIFSPAAHKINAFPLDTVA